jgi:hypothetical protein
MSRLILPDGAVVEYGDANPLVAKSAKPASNAGGTTWGQLAKERAEKLEAAKALDDQADSWANLVNSRAMSMDRELARYYRDKVSEARKSAEDLRKSAGTTTADASAHSTRTVKPARHAGEGTEGEDRGDQVRNEAEAREYDAKAAECDRRAADMTLSLPSETRREYRNQAVEHREHARRLRTHGRNRSHDLRPS